MSYSVYQAHENPYTFRSKRFVNSATAEDWINRGLYVDRGNHKIQAIPTEQRLARAASKPLPPAKMPPAELPRLRFDGPRPMGLVPSPWDWSAEPESLPAELTAEAVMIAQKFCRRAGESLSSTRP